MTKETTPDITSPQREADTEITSSSSSAPALAAPDRHSPLFVIWTEIIERCSNPLHERYPEYGGQGIKVCAEWRDFGNFQTWARANSYRSGRYLARIDLTGDYAPENCGWSTSPHRGCRPHRTYTAFGETKSLQEWAEDSRCIVSSSTLRTRLYASKWDLERALSTPVLPSGMNPGGYTLTTIPIGAQFGELTVIGACLRTTLRQYQYRYTYPCRCSCGEERSVIASSLLNGNTSYCGLRAHAILLGKMAITHGASATPLYRRWQQMRATVAEEQCRCPAESGRRAAGICAEWQDFTAFRSWAMAQGYRDACSLSRRDPRGDYTPENCVWVERKHAAEKETRPSSGPALSTHDEHSPLCVIWTEIIERCGNPLHERYSEYGGQGIKVCTEWQDFSNFQLWARANGYRSGSYLARINLQDDYSPANCGWSTLPHGHFHPLHRTFTAFGETKSLTEWAEDSRCLVSYGTLKSRIAIQWDIERALSTPAMVHPHNYTLTTIPIGAQFGELTVISPCIRTALHRERNRWRYRYLCRCSCGCERLAAGAALLNGKTTICSKPAKYHGSGTRLYAQWEQMRSHVARQRRHPTMVLEQRTIGICAEWDDFSAFRKWAMAQGYRDELYLVRHDPRGDFTPENCVWVESKPARSRAITPAKHHGSGTRLYGQWGQMRRHVAQQQRRAMSALEQRTVGICAEWDDFSAFRQWAMAQGYRDELSLIRDNPLGDYTPENCRWVDAETKSAQHHNNGRLFSAFGEMKSLPAWTRDPRCLVSYKALFGRITRGWSMETALTTLPIRQSITAYGETKPLEDWLQDPRCHVDHNTITRRLHAGWNAERALSTKLRLQHGWDPERALTTPAVNRKKG